MVIKNVTSDFQQAVASSLPYKRNEAYMTDAISSVFSKFENAAKRKQDTRHVGGIWDSVPMETSELNVGENRQALSRNETQVVTGILDPSGLAGKLIENFSMGPLSKCPGGALEDDVVMDISRSYESRFESPYPGNLNKKGTATASFEMTKDLLTKKTQSIPPQVKKKNSDDESSVERSKRSKTTSSEDIHSAVNDPMNVSSEEISNSKKYSHQTPLLKFPLKDNRLSENSIVQCAEKDAISKNKDEFYLEILESSVADDVNSSSKEMEVVENLYQEAIKTLKRVYNILESCANVPTKSLGKKVSCIKKIVYWQRICSKLNDLEVFSSNLSTCISFNNVAGNLKKQGSFDQTKSESVEAVKSKRKQLKKNQCAESKANDTSLTELSNGSVQNDTARKEHSSLPLLRQNRPDVESKKQSDGSPKSKHIEKSESPLVVSDLKCSGTIQSKDLSSSVSEEETRIDKKMNRGEILRITGSPPPAKAFKSSDQKDETSAASSTVVDTTIPFRRIEPMDDAFQSKAMTLQPEVIATSVKAKTAPSFNDTAAILPSKGTDALSSVKLKAAPSSSKVLGDTSLSKAVATPSETTPSNAVDATLPICAEVEPNETIQTKFRRRSKRSGFEVPPRFASRHLREEVDSAFKTESTSPNGPKPPLKVDEVTQSWRGERPSPYGSILQRKDRNEQVTNSELEPRPLLPWREAQRGGNSKTLVGPTKENVSRCPAGILSWRNRDEVLISEAPVRSSYDCRQRERSKARSPLLQDNTTWKKASSVGRSSVGDWQMDPKKTQNVASIEKSNASNAKRNEKASFVGTITKSTSDFCLAPDSINEVVTLKVFDDKQNLIDEMLMPNNELMQVKRKYPGMIPFVNAKHLVLEYNADAVTVFLRCICSIKYTLTSWEIALEVFALAKKYQVEILQTESRKVFDNKSISLKQVQGIMFLARKLNITQVLKTSRMFAEVQAAYVPDSEIPSPSSKKSLCFLSCTTFVEPSEFDIPLHYVEDKSLGGTRKCDIQNDIVFERTSKTFCITGFKIKVERGKFPSEEILNIFINVFKDDNCVFGEEREKPLMEDMIINFKQKLFVKPKENVKISVLIENLCIRQCRSLKQEKAEESCSMGSFVARFFSDKRNSSKKSLFYIEKVFYTFEV